MKIDVHIYALWMEHTKSYTYLANSNKFSVESSMIFIDTATVQFDPLPNEVLASKTVEAYRAEQQRIRAEAQAKVMKLQDSIDAMLCLEHKPEVA